MKIESHFRLFRSTLDWQLLFTRVFMRSSFEQRDLAPGGDLYEVFVTLHYPQCCSCIVAVDEAKVRSPGGRGPVSA